MLCPEVWNFPPPKIKTNLLESDSLNKVLEPVKMNYFYRSLIVTLPDQISLPGFIEESLLEDTEYYQISGVPLSEFVNPIFTNNFAKNGSLYCLTITKNCIKDNCVSITPDGILTIHVIDYVYQTLGLEGIKRPHNFYEVCIDLKNIKHPEKIALALKKLELFDFNVSWVPNKEEICPSSIAKYFSDKNYLVKVFTLTTNKLSPDIEEVPSIKGADIEQLVEWIGMLCIGGDLTPKESYISTYSIPESDDPMKTNRITVMVIKGFITPNIIENVCEKILRYVLSREIDQYWASLSIQSWEDCLWKWTKGAPRMFQAHESSTTIFFTQNNYFLYSAGHIKYS